MKTRRLSAGGFSRPRSSSGFGFCTHVVQGGLADRVVLDAEHLHHLLHLAEDLSQRDPLRLQLVLDLGVVSLLKRDIFHIVFQEIKVKLPVVYFYCTTFIPSSNNEPVYLLFH